jgi:hypothetical protein
VHLQYFMITFVNYHIESICVLMLRPSYIEFIYVLVLSPSSVSSFWTCSVMVDSCILTIFILLLVLLPMATHAHFTSPSKIVYIIVAQGCTKMGNPFFKYHHL